MSTATATGMVVREQESPWHLLRVAADRRWAAGLQLPRLHGSQTSVLAHGRRVW
jgi:hypothetical protein